MQTISQSCAKPATRIGTLWAQQAGEHILNVTHDPAGGIDMASGHQHRRKREPRIQCKDSARPPLSTKALGRYAYGTKPDNA